MSEQATATNTVEIERIFDAPVELVWQMWTNPEHFKNWYGPEGLQIPVAEMDARVGGKRFVGMEMGSTKMWFVGEYIEVVPNERLVYTDSFADENGNKVDTGDEPSASTVTVILEDLGGRTKMTMTHANLPGGKGARNGAQAGWSQSFDKMATRLTDLAA